MAKTIVPQADGLVLTIDGGWTGREGWRLCDDDTVIATAHLGYMHANLCLPHRTPAYISAVSSNEDYRRKGYARRVLIALIAQARAAGAPYIDLNCREGNTPAERLYASLGFTVVEDDDDWSDRRWRLVL